MDPWACWEKLCAEVTSGELDDAIETCKDLYEWLDKGGFRPNDLIPPKDRLLTFLSVLHKMNRTANLHVNPETNRR
jgi:hypothetical protein